MATLFSFLLSAVGPLLLRALTMVGIGTVTFTGVTAALDGLITMMQNNWSSVPTDILGLAAIAGVPESMGIIAGAFVARTGMWVAISATRWVVR